MTERGDVSSRLVPELLAYVTPPFVLRDDFVHLEDVQRVEAPEATLLYCGRILEALAADGMRRVGLPASPNLFANLDSLRQFNLLPTSTRYWAHALRGLANDVRHVRRPIGWLDAQFGVSLAERWLDWFFRHFRYGPRLPALTHDGRALGLCRSEELRDLMETFDAPAFDPLVLASQVLGGLVAGFFRAPLLPGVLAEVLLDRGEFDAARDVLLATLGDFPQDYRLRQLMGLHWSRRSEPARALEWLQPLCDRSEDAETVGISAGVYKRLWQEDPSRREWLEKSHRAYLRGWEHSRRASSYVGINAATTALWLGQPAAARRLACEVAQHLQARAGALARHARDPDLVFGYWDQVTLAEAHLLMGEWTVARATYRAAFEKHAEQRDNLRVTREQAARILHAQGLSTSATAAFLEARAVAAEAPPAVLVGVTGHRRLPAEAPLAEHVREVLANVGRDRRLQVLSSLAEGADRLVPQVALTTNATSGLHVVLPLELADYRRDFKTAESQAEFQALLDQAECVTFPPGLPGHRSAPNSGCGPGTEGESRLAAYEWAGLQIVERCHVLVAIWDGQPAKGRGGTGDIVAYARKVGRPVAWITTLPPFAVKWERGEESA